MKIALYIEDGLEQIVLTPEGKTEQSILAKIHDGSREIELKRGEFYYCQGGWQRLRAGDESTMLVLRKPHRDTDAGSVLADGDGA